MLVHTSMPLGKMTSTGGYHHVCLLERERERERERVCVCLLVHTFAHTCSPQRQHIGTACGPEREMRQKDSKLVAHVAHGAMKLAQRCEAAMS